MAYRSPYSGPHPSDPLTEGELSLLLAVPRAAQNTPNATLFRLPLGPDPALGWIHVTCAETYRIVSRLAAVWSSRLAEILGGLSGEPKVGPGTTVCLLVDPPVHSIFHFLALWSLGCTVQYMATNVDPEVVDVSLRQSGCKVVVYSSERSAWAMNRKEQFKGQLGLIELPEEEQAPRIAQTEKEGKVEPPPWPEPQRPTPALIIHSSATTGTPKLLQFSLYYYTIGLPFNCQSYLALAHPQASRTKTPYTHPRLVLTHPFWQSYHRFFFIHLCTATPMAFAHVPRAQELSYEVLLSWGRSFDVGAVVCPAIYFRNMPPRTLEENADFFRSLYSITVSGSAVDEHLSAQFEKHELAISNEFGQSEITRLMAASRAPFMHLRPFPDVPPPLVYPISDPNPDGSQQVQLWYSISSSPFIAHLAVEGGVPLKLEPFPGQGPHHGELALNWGDVFLQVQTESAGSSKTAYIHIGRTDDFIRLGGTGQGNLNASVYELELWPVIQSRLGATTRTGGWIVDAIQLFGGNMACTALVVQLRRTSQGEVAEMDEGIVRELAGAVEEVNGKLKFGKNTRVHPGKRMLVVTLGGGVYGSGAERLVDARPQLMMTHKRTLQRWRNIQIFKPWLDGLEFDEP